jgi:hypothetical protein
MTLSTSERDGLARKPYRCFFLESLWRPLSARIDPKNSEREEFGLGMLAMILMIDERTYG